MAANLALVIKGTPTLDELDSEFFEGATTAQTAYALAYGAVDQLASLDTVHGLSRFFETWKREGTMERAVRLNYGMTMAEFEQRWQGAPQHPRSASPAGALHGRCGRR